MTILEHAEKLTVADVDNMLQHYRRTWQTDPTTIDKIDKWLEVRQAMVTGRAQVPDE